MALSAVPATLSSHFICYAAEDITWTSNVIIRSRACLLAYDTSFTAGAAMCRNIIVKWNIVTCQLVLIQEAVTLHTTHTPPRPTTRYTHTPHPTTAGTPHLPSQQLWCEEVDAFFISLQHINLVRGAWCVVCASDSARLCVFCKSFIRWSMERRLERAVSSPVLLCCPLSC